MWLKRARLASLSRAEPGRARQGRGAPGSAGCAGGRWISRTMRLFHYFLSYSFSLWNWHILDYLWTNIFKNKSEKNPIVRRGHKKTLFFVSRYQGGLWRQWVLPRGIMPNRSPWMQGRVGTPSGYYAKKIPMDARTCWHTLGDLFEHNTSQKGGHLRGYEGGYTLLQIR